MLQEKMSLEYMSFRNKSRTIFKRAQVNQDCAKFESHTNRVTFETNAIRMISTIQALCIIQNLFYFK